MLRLIDADGVDVDDPVMGNTEFRVQGPSLECWQTFMSIFDVTFEKYGQYSFRLTVQNVEVARTAFAVVPPSA